MSIHLVTGRGTGDHVTSADAGSLHAGIVGTGRYVLNRGSQFAYEVISNNLVKIKDGDLLNQGRHMNIALNDYEECTIENGLQSVKRNDLIVIRYEKNTETEIESASVVVIKGTSGDTAVDPEYTTGNILSGDTTDDFPLYRVRLNGLNIEGVDGLFTVNKSMEELDDDIIRKANQTELDTHLGNTIIHITSSERNVWNGASNNLGTLSLLTTTIKTSIVNAINSLVAALNTHKVSTDHDGRYLQINKIQTGWSSSNSVAAGSYSDVTVTYPYAFSKPPMLSITFGGTSANIGYGDLQCSIYNGTTTQFTVRIFNKYTSTLSPSFSWIAIDAS